MDSKSESSTFGRRLSTMLKVDFHRMLTMPLVYILIACCLLMPIAILVMTSMMDGTTTTDPETKEEIPVEGFDNTWQIIGSVSDSSSAGDNSAEAMEMDIVSMCNINMLYFFIAVLVCVFVAEDFRSGFSKCLFTVRAKKTDYVISKTIVCFFGGALMILAFFVGAVIGGRIANLPFDMVGFNAFNLVMCILSKMIIVLVFIPIYLLMSVIAKQRLWLSLILSFMVGMFLFMVIPIVTPLNSTPMHALLCLVGGGLFSAGLGAVSNIVLKNTSIV
ncbi:MAG: ABC transporter permease [Clostridia bacterium]|nr:ABC transporter permease [Clostridia bacterium]